MCDSEDALVLLKQHGTSVVLSTSFIHGHLIHGHE